MFAPESLGDIAIPANRHMSFENFRQFFGSNFVPLLGSAIGPKQRRLTVMPAQFNERFLAIPARFPFVPLADNVPDKASFGISFYLAQALLSAILPLRPLRALIQSNLIVAHRRSLCCTHGIHVHRGGLERLRASHQALPAIPKVTRKRHRHAEDNPSDYQNKNGGKDEVGKNHKYLQGPFIEAVLPLSKKVHYRVHNTRFLRASL
jgi:hypothetical protein